MNGASIGEVSDEFAIHIPKALIPDCTTGHTTAKIRDIITDHKITTSGTNLLPLKKDNASGSFLKL